MARQNAQLLAFNRGEVSKIALARIDVAKLALATQCQVNWMPWVLGPASLRPGLLHIGEVSSDNAAQLVDFVYSKTDTALIELTSGIMRVWINDALIARNLVGTTVSDPSFAGGGTWSTADTTAGCTTTIAAGTASLNCAAIGGLARMKQTIAIAPADQSKEHGLRIQVTSGPVTVRAGSADGLQDYITTTALDTGTHSLAMTPTGANVFLQIESTDHWNKTLALCTIEGAGVLTVPTPWTSAGTLASLRWTQSGDTIYVAQYGGQQYKIERRGVRPGARGWSVAVYQSVAGPFLAGPSSPALLTIGACFGSTTLSSSLPFFQPGHVGALFQLFTPGQGGARATLGALNAATPAIRVSGSGQDRGLVIQTSGTWVGTLQVQRSYDGPTSGFVNVAQDNQTTPVAGSFTGNVNYSGATTWFDGKNTANTNVLGLDNLVVWYRIVFTAYTSGTASISFAYSGGGVYGICRVTGYSNPTIVTADILQPFSGPTPTQSWQESVWSGVQSWPTAPAFQEGRLWWASGGALPIVGSQSNNYTGFAQIDEFGNELGDSGAILESFGQGPNDSVNWLLPLQRLLCGREQSISSIRSSSIDTPLTPTNFAVKDASQQGAARLPPVKIGKNGIMVQQNGAKVYELTLSNAYLGDYADRDLTRLNLDIGKPGFTDTAVAIQPDATMLLPRTDGQLACLLYDPNDEVEAWWRAMTLGVIERARVLPNFAGGTDDFVYLVVNRTINGVTRRFIEKLAQRSECVGGALNKQLDCALTYTGAAVATGQIPWLPKTLISVWADGAAIGTTTTDIAGNFTMPDGKTHSNWVAGLAGAVIIGSTNNPLSNNVPPNVLFANGPQANMVVGTQYNGYPAEVFADIGGTGRPPQHIGSLTVAAGLVSLPNGQVASTIIAFLGFVAPLQTAKLAYGAQGGSALTQKKKVDHVGLVLYDTGAAALQFGQRMDLLDPMPLIESDQLTPAGTVWSEYDGPPIEIPGEWDTDARVCLLAQAPNPCMVGGVVVAMATNER